MPATITSTGTFTDLVGLGVIPSPVANPSAGATARTPGSAIPPNTTGNNMDMFSYNLDGLKTADGVMLDELRQFVQLVAVAYGLLFWPAMNLVYTLLKAEIQTKRDMVMLGDSASANRLFIP